MPPAGRSGLLLLVAVGFGCAAPGPTSAPVVERSIDTAAAPASYVVQRGDSLYAIAWRYQMDYKAIARLNGIGPPYTIYPDQTLRLRAGAATPRRQARASRTAAREANRSRAPAPSARPRVAAKPTAPKAPVAERKRPAAAERAPSRPTSTAPPPAAGKGGWRWPVTARPQRGFGGGNRGVDYTLPKGGAVAAAAAGQVVYAGPGLGGFQHLVILEHGRGYLSAYSLNAAPKVAEGGTVTAGDPLAAVGSGGAVSRQLHFEIRRNGAPVNPAGVIGR